MMTKERRAELEALADKDPHMFLLRELLNEIAELKARADRVLGEGVVVPELTTDDAHRELLRVSPGGTYSAVQEDSFRDGYDFARTRAIPSDRVLEDGMVAMSAIVWATSSRLLGSRSVVVPPLSSIWPPQRWATQSQKSSTWPQRAAAILSLSSLSCRYCS